MKLIVKLKFKRIILVIHILFIISQVGEKNTSYNRAFSAILDFRLTNNAEPKPREYEGTVATIFHTIMNNLKYST